MQTKFLVIFGAKHGKYLHISYFDPTSISNCETFPSTICNLTTVLLPKMEFKRQFLWSEMNLNQTYFGENDDRLMFERALCHESIEPLIVESGPGHV